MYTAHVVLVPHDNEFARHFRQRHIQLAAVPRVGEFVTTADRDGMGQAFVVLAVLHPANPDAGTATVELRLRHWGTSTDLFVALEEGPVQA